MVISIGLLLLVDLFFGTTCARIDVNQENVKFQFPHKKCMEHFPKKKKGAAEN
jgi:hypothetical protein